MKKVLETDVLIVGYGAAGANAAIAAHDAGARVLMVEKMPAGGGNSALCAGAMVIPESLEAAIAYYRALSSGTADEAMIRAFAAAMMDIPDLLRRLGVDYLDEPPIASSFPSRLPGSLRQMHIRPTGENGFRLLDSLVRSRNIEILTQTQVSALIMHPDSGAVLGAVAQRHGQQLQLLARKAVILTCGGYAGNPDMLANFNLPGASGHVFSWGSPGNTGDGIHLATTAGAALWHMAALEWGKFCARAPSREFGTAVGYGLGRTRRAGSYLFVNQRGQRFMAEDAPLSHYKGPLDILRYDHRQAQYANLPAYLICDQTHLAMGALAPTAAMFRRQRGGVVGHALVNGVYDWSEDNQAEIAAGWIMPAPTIAALAGTIGADPEALQTTISLYNRACDARCDTAFGRQGKTLRAFQTPPYYAIELGLSLVNTQGGPRRNADCQVLDHRGSVIPRLYAAGELGSFFGFLYQIGSNYPEAWAFGQIAGKRAAAESTA